MICSAFKQPQAWQRIVERTACEIHRGVSTCDNTSWTEWIRLFSSSSSLNIPRKHHQRTIRSNITKCKSNHFDTDTLCFDLVNDEQTGKDGGSCLNWEQIRTVSFEIRLDNNDNKDNYIRRSKSNGTKLHPIFSSPRETDQDLSRYYSLEPHHHHHHHRHRMQSVNTTVLLLIITIIIIMNAVRSLWYGDYYYTKRYVYRRSGDTMALRVQLCGKRREAG